LFAFLYFVLLFLFPPWSSTRVITEEAIYLGLTFEQDLKWKSRITNICTKASNSSCNCHQHYAYVSLSVGEEHVSDALDHLELIDIAFLVDVQFRTSILEIIIEVMIHINIYRFDPERRSN
jgi:hypothetical protein